LLAHRYFNVTVRLLYGGAAVWLGCLNFFFLAACASWAVCLGSRLAGLRLDRQPIAAALFGLAVLATVLGAINARWVRIRRVSVQLPNLPESWRGRVAALVTDVHLGHIKGRGFMRRIVVKLQKLAPDVVFIAGDLFDGTPADFEALVAPWREFSCPLGAYFATGNHEEFLAPAPYMKALRHVGIRALNNEKAAIDGLRIIGVRDYESADPARFNEVLEGLSVKGEPAVLLSHTPRGLKIVEAAGISLQLSGHTHGGQMFPFTWFTARVFGRFTHGLNRFGKLQVYTSTGAGTWGPPVRLGTIPEIVLIEFT
jgi:predicted MPP superfamily phosphohydrolase